MRADFSARTKRLIAARAAYQCSFPGCGAPTIGPDQNPDRSVLTGEAAHIFSAADAGPRGTGGLSVRERAQHHNGIWLCRVHAKLVDARGGAAYPAGVLLSYKKLHETLIARRLYGVSTPFGWIDEIEVHRSPIFQGVPRLTLGKCTLLAGPNGSGKSSLCDWLVGAFDPASLERWKPVTSPEEPIRFSVRFHNPEEHAVTVICADRAEYFVDREALPLNPFTVRFTRLNWRIWRADGHNDLQFLAAQLNTDANTVHNLLSGLDPRKRGVVKAVDVDSAGLVSVQFGSGPLLPLEACSEGEQLLVGIELAVAHAEFTARYSPTVLILDGALNVLDRGRFSSLANFLANPAHAFQTVLVTYEGQRRQLDWAGWSFTVLQGRSPDVVATQQWNEALPA